MTKATVAAADVSEVGDLRSYLRLYKWSLRAENRAEATAALVQATRASDRVVRHALIPEPKRHTQRSTVDKAALRKWSGRGLKLTVLIGAWEADPARRHPSCYRQRYQEETSP